MLLIGMLLIGSPGMVQADVVVLQPLDPTSTGEFSNLGPANQQAADDFSLAQATILDSISWFGRYGAGSVAAPIPTDFSIRFFEDSGGAPAIASILQLDVSVNPVTSGLNYSPGVGAADIPWFSYAASLPALTLEAATYWVSVVENDSTTPTSGNTQWLWADSNTLGLRAIRNNDSDAWSASPDIDHAFSLTGTVVPVPAAVWLFATALAGLVGFSARKQAS